jgi:hypothetical protein
LIEVKKEITPSAPPHEHSFKKDRGEKPCAVSFKEEGGTKKPSVPGGAFVLSSFCLFVVVIPTSELWQGRGERANVEQSVASAGQW